MKKEDPPPTPEGFLTTRTCNTIDFSELDTSWRFQYREETFLFLEA